LQVVVEDHAIKVLPHNKEAEVQVAAELQVLVQAQMVQQILAAAEVLNTTGKYLQVLLVLVVQV
jgi:hypothetical protein|tara:strand:- start:164 stop:355 length:192 start_codon:yes stop_codon:yes gene_type:complete